MAKSTSAAWLMLAILAVTSGCGDAAPYEGPQRYPVKGTASFDGEPIVNGVITFIPSGDGRKASGRITDGSYLLTEEYGPELGSHRVEILWEKPTGQKTISDGQEVDVTKQVIPDRFNTNTELTADVADTPENTFNFDLKSK